jgi:PAS domain S-box-containing protein
MDGLSRARAPAMRPPPQVLVIDDSVEVLDTLSAVLRPHYRVLIARSGPAGLEIARRRPAPDLVLLDVVMPAMDGYAVLSELKANAETRDIPVIFLTALAGTEDEERGLERGAADYVSKPVKPLNLLARVRNHLAIANRTAALAASEARMRAVVEGARDAIFTTDDDGRILSINSEGARIFGYGRDELVGADVRSIISRAPGVSATGDRGVSNGDARRMEIPGRRRDGALFPLEYAASRILVDGKWINVCFGRDLSPQRAAEATMQRLRSERITAIGGVASALAHEVNQPFLAAVAYLDTARHILEKIRDDCGSSLDDAVRSASDEIMRAG